MPGLSSLRKPAIGKRTAKSFVSAAERQRQQDANQAKERQEAEDRRRKQADDARERQMAERVKAYRQSLTPEGLARIEADAVAAASEESRRNLDNPDMTRFRKTLISRLINDHVARLLEAEANQA